MWSEKWLKPDYSVKNDEPVHFDELRLKKIDKKLKKGKGSWEVDFFYAPFVIQEGGRPYYPYLALYVDGNTSMILNFTLSSYSEHIKTFHDGFLDFVENIVTLPDRILAGNDAAYGFFKPFADKFGIDLIKTKKLNALIPARKSFFQSMGKYKTISHISPRQSRRLTCSVKIKPACRLGLGDIFTESSIVHVF